MKKLLALALLVALFSSCLKLDDDTSYVQDFVFMGTVTTGGIHPVFLLDGGYSVTPEATMPADTFELGERYYLHFVLGDTSNHPSTYPITIYRYGKTIIKDPLVLPKDSTDKWYDQPVNMANIWYSSHYCNLFFVSFAGVGSPNSFELIRRKDSESTTPTDTLPKLIFELRHNAPEYSTYYSYFRYYSFDLSSLQTEFPNASKFQISFKWNDYKYGSQTYSQKYYPNLVFATAELPAAAQTKPSFGLTP